MKIFSARTTVFAELRRIQEGFLEVVCPDQTFAFGDSRSKLRAMIVVNEERFFRRVLLGGDIGLGEAYMDGDWYTPDLVAVLRLAVCNIRQLDSSHSLHRAAGQLVGRLRHWTRQNTIKGSRRNIRRHYDLGNHFYEMFLGETMAYSCALFQSESDSLELAQQRKLDRICRKLRLSPGDRVLEIGCGWGSFAVHAAARYGCHVTAATISRQQYEYARSWVSREGLGSQVDLQLRDYRELAGSYDRIVSIEMFEAVGYENYDTFFSICNGLLKPAGSMLLQTITITEQQFPAYLRSHDFTRKHIFPGGELASMRGIIRSLAEVTQMSLHHAENIGWHYARTLNIWRKRFLESSGLLPELGFDLNFARMWDFYLAYCEAAFLERHISDYQLLIAKNHNREPLMFDPWETEPAQAAGTNAIGQSE